jgi:prepilin-type N-terminal cleavage/methylation domain-containing protein
MPRRHEGRSEAEGFTLAEVLVAVAVLGLLAALGAMSGNRFVAGQQVESAIRRVATGVERGREAALRLGRPCALRLDEGGWEAPEGGELIGCAGAELTLQEGVADGTVRLRHNFAGDVRFTSNGLVLDGGTVVVEGAGTDLRRCLVMALPLGVVRLGRYQPEGGAGANPAACRPDATL